MLDYPPLKKVPILQIFLNHAYLECPNLHLSLESVFGGIGHSGFEIHVLQVCSAIRPRKKTPCFRFFLTKHISNAPTYAFHQNLILLELVTVASRSGSFKCARLSAPEKGLHVSDFFETSIFPMPQPMPLTRTCFGGIGHNGFEIQVLQVCSAIRPPSHRHTGAQKR